MTRPRIVCLVGPTASGKSALALDVAERLGAEIVSADSRQLYRGLDIGTAKPTAAERARVPHHCLHLVDADAIFDAARFREAATAAIARVSARGRPVLVVGGSGLYVRVLLRGLCPAPPRAPALRAALIEKMAVRGRPAMHRALAAIDPEAAGRISPQDGVRVVRALEVGLTTGMPLSRWQARHAFAETPYEALVIGLARPTPELDRRIAARAETMMAAGFLEEVRALRARGISEDATALRAVGYREMLACIEGRLDEATALAATVRATRQFAKRQRMWFRREPGIRWRHPEAERELVVREIDEFVRGISGVAHVAGRA
jgi:tRNA dimethylallyltransferase